MPSDFFVLIVYALETFSLQNGKAQMGCNQHVFCQNGNSDFEVSSRKASFKITSQFLSDGLDFRCSPSNTKQHNRIFPTWWSCNSSKRRLVLVPAWSSGEWSWGKLGMACCKALRLLIFIGDWQFPGVRKTTAVLPRFMLIVFGTLFCRGTLRSREIGRRSVSVA